ncbi:hypothetical protein EMIHUDRAFT_449606, partial [Emiliania huxleyi CCMP1516]|uniref:Uncharacterized protein n=2 Tax=Emiliania huxleyi TaxID=2903 RepID=A0A0D3K5C8_EMIH1
PPPTLAPVSEAVHLRERGEQLLAPLSPTTGTRLRPVAHAGWLLRVRLRSRPHVDRAARSVGGVSEQLRSLAPDGVRRRRPPQPELLRALLPRSGHRRRRRRQRVVAEAHHVLVPHLSGAARFRRRVARRPQRVGRRQRSQRLVAQGRSADRHVRGARRQVRGGARHRRPLPPPHRQIDPGLARLFLLRHGGGRRALRDCLRLRLAAPLQRAAGRVRRARPGHAGRRLLRRRPLRDSARREAPPPPAERARRRRRRRGGGGRGQLRDAAAQQPWQQQPARRTARRQGASWRRPLADARAGRHRARLRPCLRRGDRRRAALPPPGPPRVGRPRAGERGGASLAARPAAAAVGRPRPLDAPFRRPGAGGAAAAVRAGSRRGGLLLCDWRLGVRHRAARGHRRHDASRGAAAGQRAFRAQRRARCRRPAVDREVVGRVPRDGPHAVVLGCGARHERGRRVQVVSLARPVRGVLAGAVPPHPRRAGGRLGADAPRAGGRQPRRELARRVALPDRLPPRPAAGRHRHDRAPPLARDAHLLLRRPPARDRCARVGLRRHGVDRAQPQLADGRRRRVGVRRAAGLPRGRDHGGRARRQCGDGAD